MIEVTPHQHRSRCTVSAIEGTTVSVTLSGPASGRTIIMLEEPARNPVAQDALRARLQVAMFRIVTIPIVDGLSAKSIVGFLDQLQIASGLLVGDGAGAELAWDLAATHRERFTGLVAIDRGHPRVPNADGIIRDGDCPAVEVDTTILAEGRSAHAVARASRRHVHADFRLVDLAGPRSSQHFTAQLATEIVMRALSR
ncbi:alpha/beta hydrolase family protein [Mycolicibacterium vinylchloridicum]|jgi:pimeloyl-ACP methyl ester carboxylesterase|uniref:alpha/beta hydrolase n=1 Tax=Mycolicibacterium vinylchloridicum TaxID=2736928 RepID=UPI0015C7A9F6|nr:alpha/beta hydrolase [Mycolicibacterium vinylchloridicum]